MPNPLALKLRTFADLTDAESHLIDSVCTDVRLHKAKTTLIREGDRPEVVFLLLEGWACRFKVLPDGKRQIMAYLLPGDLCDPHIFILKSMDHSIGLLSDAKVAAIPKEKVLELIDHSPQLARAIWWTTMVDEGTLREWLVNIGQRDAHDRIAHLLSELWVRLRAVGLTDEGAFDLPATQEDLADTMGLTPIHVNRMLQRMRQGGLIELSRGRIRIPDVPRLMRVTNFEPNYLHLERRRG